MASCDGSGDEPRLLHISEALLQSDLEVSPDSGRQEVLTWSQLSQLKADALESMEGLWNFTLAPSERTTFSAAPCELEERTTSEAPCELQEDSNMAATTAPSTSPVRARILPPHLQHRFDSLASTVPDSEDVDPEADVVKAEAKDTALDKADDCAVKEVETMETMETEPKAKEEAPQERHWAFELLHWLQNACASCAEVPNPDLPELDGGW
ncbi:unnamed protein product [Effrenium voratum]|nr:unnamed protein product [Effrenium voratum]